MVSFTSILLALTAAVSSQAAPASDSTTTTALSKRTQPGTGYDNGYYYSFWTDGGGSINYQIGADGSYTAEWNNVGNFLAGKGWKPGSARTINYYGDFNPSGNGYLSVYGWTTSPLIEYYIVESFGTYDPSSGAQYRGSVYSDGSNYNIHQPAREQALDTSTFTQFWSVRENQRTSGAVTTGNHFDAWAEYGLQLGSFDYQIVATEGYQSSGSSSITVY